MLPLNTIPIAITVLAKHFYEWLSNGSWWAFDGFRGIPARFWFWPTRLAFAAFGFVAFDGFTGFESHQKPRKAIKSRFAGFLMYPTSDEVPGPIDVIKIVIRMTGFRGLWLGQTGTLI